MPNTQIETLNKAIAAGGGILAFARRLNISHQAVYQWKAAGYVPADRALEIQLVYGVPFLDLVSADTAARLSTD